MIGRSQNRQEKDCRLASPARTSLSHRVKQRCVGVGFVNIVVSEHSLRIRHDCHGIFSGKEYLRKDFHGAHQEKCQKSSKKIEPLVKKIQLVKKNKRKTTSTGQKDATMLKCYICSKQLKSPSIYQNHLSTSHYANELMIYLKRLGEGDNCWSCSICDYSAPSRWPLITHVGSKHMRLKEVAHPEVWASIPPRYSQAGGAQRWPQGLVIASVESEVPAPPFEASTEAEAELPKTEAPVAVSPVIKQEPVGWTRWNGSTPICEDPRDIFDVTSDEESDDEIEPVIENLGSQDLASKSPLLVSTSPQDEHKRV